VIRYAKLGYVALNVSDIEASKKFYTEIVGLQLSGVGPNGELHLRCSSAYHDIILYQGDPVGLRRVAWEMESEAEVERLIERLRGQDIAVHRVPEEECLALHQEDTYRFVDPRLGVTVEFFSCMHSFGEGFTPSVADIQRLGHVVIKTPDVREVVKQYVGLMNFRVSDQVDGVITFMRCFPNPYHHSLGIGTGPAVAFHHVNFMVREIDDIGRAMTRFRQKGVPMVWGPGRHPPSESVFLYFLDPDGLTLEYSFGMEEFPEVNPRKHRSLAPGLSAADSWGTFPQPDFSARGAVVQGADIPQ
jgi:2,3-dihydroxy-p-cumate/2,3-dihydroxybenzoate 3,4-dioxygenase